VEDDPHVGAELAAELEIRGYQVTWVRDATHGAPRADAPTPDVVVLDYFLPLGDGIELTRAWKAQARPPIVLLVSGTDVTREVQRRLPQELRPEGIFAKPIGTSAVIEELHRHLPPPPSRGLPSVLSVKRASPDKTPSTLRSIGLPDILWRLSQKRRTGALELHDTDATLVVHLINGDPVYVESHLVGETLGRLLLRQGLLSSEQYEHILRRVTDTLITGEDVRFGEVAVALGYVSAEHVIEAMRTQVREKMVNLFHSEKHLGLFRDGKDPRLLGGAFRVDMAEVLCEGVRRHFGENEILPVLSPHLSSYVGLTPELLEMRARFRFGPREERFLGQIRGHRTLGWIVEEGGLDRIHALQILFVLTVVDALRVSESPVPRAGVRAAPAPLVPERQTQGEGKAREAVLARHLRVSGRSHYAVLGVAPTAQRAEIEEAFRRLGETYAPEKLVTLSLGDAHERATELWAQIVLAHETLTDPHKRTAYDELERQAVRARSQKLTTQEQERRRGELEAEAAFQRGLRELAADRVVHATLAFAQAQSLAPSEPEYACYAIWSEHLQAIEAGTPIKESAQVARSRMEAALIGHRPRPRSLYTLALACQAALARDTALQHLRAALAFDPEFHEARRLLGSMTEPAAPKTRR
jgi:CheY-like chemotaxis protein